MAGRVQMDRCGPGRRGDNRLSLARSAECGRRIGVRMAKKLPPVHPGEILREEFLVPLKLTPYAVAAALHVPRTRIERIAREEKPVTADTALRLGKFFKTGAAFWMNMQARFDLETAEDVLAPQIEDRVVRGGVSRVRPLRHTNHPTSRARNRGRL